MAPAKLMIATAKQLGPAAQQQLLDSCYNDDSVIDGVLHGGQAASLKYLASIGIDLHRPHFPMGFARTSL